VLAVAIDIACFWLVDHLPAIVVVGGAIVGLVTGSHTVRGAV
jgi:hypothetical protein